MADRPLTPQERAATIERLTRSQAMLQETFASGRVPVDEEIRIRTQFADVLVKTCDHLRHPQLLQDGIQHLETILRRVPQTSPDYLKHLNALCHARTSEYLMTHSGHALDEAVKAGQRALEFAQSTALQLRDPEGYLEILNNLSFALSRRNAVSMNLDDLELAIMSTREIYEIAPRGSDRYLISLNNLVSQLRRHFTQANDQNSLDEAERLMNEMLSCTTPGTMHHGVALGQLGIIGSAKFNHTKLLEDLDIALVNCKAGLDALPNGHEIRPDMLTAIVELYAARYSTQNEAADLASLVHYSRLRLEAFPKGSQSRGIYLLNHLRRVQKYIFEEQTLEALESAIAETRNELSNMPSNYPQQEKCQLILSDLLGAKYSMSNELQDLMNLVNFLETMVTEHNHRVEMPGSSEQSVTSKWIRDLKSQLKELTQAPVESSMRGLAEQELAGIFLSFSSPEKAAVVALEEMYKMEYLRLEIITKAIERGQELSEEEIDIQAEKLKDEKAATEANENTRQRYRAPEFETEFGLRKLAVDTQSKNIPWDLSNVMRCLLGYEPTQGVPLKQFIAREARIEQLAIEKNLSEGRHPNLALCHMCRDLAKPLQPSGDGFELTAKNGYLPFGNFSQLDCRQHCTICSFILSAVTSNSGELIPLLQAIDDEIQGTRLSTGILSTGEKVMRVDYGLQQVTELRILTPKNYTQAVRQGWESGLSSSIEALLQSGEGPAHDPHGQQVNLDLIKSWLNRCDHNHGSACNNPRSEARAATDRPMIFIDVKEQCLVPATSAEKYFALSYVWGQVDMCKTLKANYEERRVPMALSKVPFPKTIRDAISFVHSLGERFLWIDAICMVQDDAEQMATDIPNMDVVYGKAYATIVALYGDSADAGLPGVAAGTRAPQQIGILNVSNQSPDLDYDGPSGKNHAICLVSTPRPLHLTLNASRWNSRGWILQERLLSRRCLYFSPEAAYFQCSQDTWTEAGTNEAYSAKMLDDRALDDEIVLRAANHNNPLSDIDGLHDIGLRERVERAFRVYKRLVETYTPRQFSFKSDVLNGFAGVFAVLERYFQSDTLMGLPAAVFSHALLWSPVARSPRRGCRLPTPDNLAMGKPDTQFASWSWAGWDGPVEYRLFGERDEEVQLPKPLITRYQLGTSSSPKIIEVEKNGLNQQTTQRSDMSALNTAGNNDPGAESPSQNATRRPCVSSESKNTNTSPLPAPYGGNTLHPQTSLSDRNGIKPQYIQSFNLAGVWDFFKLAAEGDSLGQESWGNYWDSVNLTSGLSADAQTASLNLSQIFPQGLSAKFVSTPGAQGSSSKRPESDAAQKEAKVLGDPSRGSNWVVMPPPKAPEPWDSPLDANILSFTAPTIHLSAFHISPEKEYLIQQTSIHTQGQQAIRRIYDRQGRHCGLWWEQAGYGYVGLGFNHEAEKNIHMVAISEYGDVYHPRKGPSRVEGEIRLFHDEVFPSVGSGSGIVNILAVDFNIEKPENAGYRCTVAIVHKRAWDAVEPQLKAIRIA